MGFLIWAVVSIAAIAAFFALDSDVSLALSQGLPEKAFSGQVIWVTGASSGIGAQLSRDLSVRNAKVIISARREQQLKDLKQECEAKGSATVDVMPLDVTDHAAVRAVHDAIVEKYGRIDTLVLNPGVSQRALATQTSVEDSMDLFKINVFSYINMATIILPQMLKQGGGGSLVVVSSIAGKMGTPVSSTYSATKFALSGYFDALRAEEAANGIHVLIVCPGPVVSEITQHAMTGESQREADTDEGVKMSTERASELMLRAMHGRLDEAWISAQPFLLITYLSEYAPGLARFLFKNVFGPARVNAFLGGGNVFSVKEALLFAFGKQ